MTGRNFAMKMFPLPSKETLPRRLKESDEIVAFWTSRYITYIMSCLRSWFLFF